jgi:hypothetical protein
MSWIRVRRGSDYHIFTKQFNPLCIPVVYYFKLLCTAGDSVVIPDPYPDPDPGPRDMKIENLNKDLNNYRLYFFSNFLS